MVKEDENGLLVVVEDQYQDFEEEPDEEDFQDFE